MRGPARLPARRPSAKEVARAFGYSRNSFHVLCHHFRRETQPTFFLSPRHGPQTQPKKSAAVSDWQARLQRVFKDAKLADGHAHGFRDYVCSRTIARGSAA